MRIAVFIIAAVNLSIWLYAAITEPAMPDAVGGDTFLPALGIALAVVTTPALILAATGRFLWAALALVLLPEFFFLMSRLTGF